MDRFRKPRGGGPDTLPLRNVLRLREFRNLSEKGGGGNHPKKRSRVLRSSTEFGFKIVSCLARAQKDFLRGGKAKKNCGEGT